LSVKKCAPPVVRVHAQEQQGGVQERTKRHVDSAGSPVLLRRSKRRWVLTTIVLEENDPGPFPKKAGDLFNDRAENYSIKYLISGPGVDEAPEKGLFYIDDLNGEVFVKRAIDREKTPLFVVRFDATDRLTGQVLDKSLIFNVEVRDKNDNAPRFSQTVYNLSLKETTNLDSPILHVTATDDDREDSPNSAVSYYLIRQIPDLPNVKFTVDPKNGLIRGEGCLNYEASNFIRLIVGAKDNGPVSLSNSTTVNIRIQDGNNNMPVFTSGDKYEFTVGEGELKHELLRLKPLDFEGTPTKTVIITVENEEPYFSCENKKLRMDKAVASPNVTVLITVLDSNDAPVFTPNVKVFREKENVVVGTVLGTFTATDPDRVPNNIRYKIAQDPAGWMTVDENTGVVSTTQVLDRESPFVNGSTYTALIYAIDDELPIPCTVGTIIAAVQLLDRSYRQREGTSLQPPLYDRREGERIGACRKFTIENLSVQLLRKQSPLEPTHDRIVQRNPVRRTKSAVKSARVYAALYADKYGEPPATGTGTISLYISDVNDNTPELTTPYMYRCDHQLDVPFTIEATDKDIDPFAGPFKFDLADHSKSMAQMWQVEKVSVNETKSDDDFVTFSVSLLSLMQPEKPLKPGLIELGLLKQDEKNNTHWLDHQVKTKKENQCSHHI
ncbi:hypothetical protein AB205_0165900, partial [Aquarana catesbeiana]